MLLIALSHFFIYLCSDAKTSRPSSGDLYSVLVDTVPSCSKNELESLVLCSNNNNKSHFIHVQKPGVAWIRMWRIQKVPTLVRVALH